MGLDDLILKKTVKKYLRNLLTKWLNEALPSDLTTPAKIANFLAEKAETVWEENFL